MATSFQPNVHYTFGSPLSPTSLFGPRRASGILEQENYTNTVFQAGSSRRGSRRVSGGGASTLAEVVNSLSRRDDSDMISSIDADYASLLDWIRCERMRKLPPEGSGYDKALVWAALFVERLHTFDSAIEQFAGDSHMAAQLAYVHCGSLLELGEQNSAALQDLFGFFYRCSMGLGNLLDRTELFMVSQDIKDQLILALADLVTLVVNVATHFHRSLLTSESVSIDICSWLEPEDPVLANITETTAHFAQEREESTCLWISPYLTRFLKNDQQILAITGKPGSGKSILSTVINDHLQHPVGGVTYKSIFAPISSRIPANTTPRAVAKTILSQLFSKRIGNVRLYQILADAYDRSQRIIDEEAYDDSLWSAMGSALKASLKGAKELVLVVDGVDEASCGETILLRRLHEAAQNATKVKLIVLSSQKHTSGASQTDVNITPELIFDDIAAVSRKVLQHSHAFNSMSEEDQELNVTRVTEAANGSFLQAKLTTKRVCDEHPTNGNALTRSIESMVKAGYTVNDHVWHTLQSKLNDDGKKILVWLATAVRPLTHRELTALVSIQIDKATVTERDVDLYQTLKPVASLVFFQNNLVYLRHGQVRAAILDVFSKDKFVPVIKNRNSDLAKRLLLYAKQAVTDTHDPSVTPLDANTTEALLEKFPLLDFALRYWVNHTRIAFGCTTNQEIIAASKELRSVIPTCPTIPLLEMTVWENKSSPALRSLHEIETRLYRQILTTNHPTTLQTILCQALFYRRIHESLPAHISRIFYDAAKISQEVLSARHLITMQMTKYFLETTADQVSESKTEVMVQRIEMLQLLVECYRIHYGVSSSTVTSTLTQLSEHYHSIKEERKAQEITKSIQGSTTTTTETTFQQRTGSRQIDDSLLVHLRGRKDKTEEGMVLVLDGIEADELITRSFSFETLFTKAERAATEGHVKEAESWYVQLWQQASQEYRLNRSTEWELRNARAVLSYSKFLKSQRRENEAASILGGFWDEYEQTSSSSETVVAQFMEVAKTMKSVGLSVLALGVFKHCAQSSDSKSSIYEEAEQHIQSTSREVMRMASTSSSVVTESSLKEMVYNSTSTDQVSTTATNTLVEMYLSQHRWHDATKVIKTVLQSIWPALFAPSLEDVVLPSTEVGYCVELADRLASCYRSRRRPVKEEDIRVRLYRAVRRDRPAGDRLLERVTSTLLRLYERTSQTDKAISIHQDVLHDSAKRYGDEHPTVIKKLWTLAELTRPRPIAVDYYRQLVHILNKDSESCHADAFEPLIIVATELLNQGRYSEALKPCRVLFNTLQNPKISQKLHDQAFVQTIYERYVHCLRMVHSDAASVHDVTVQYRKTCISLFGATASVTLMATKTLANICQESRRYEGEAVQLYEELLRTKNTDIELDHQDIRATLDAIDEEQSSSLASVKVDQLTPQQLQHVVSVRTQRLSTIRSTQGWAHEEALSQMEEISSLYAKRGETHAASSMLQEATVQVLSTETSSTKLTAAAKSIASSYIAAGQVQRAKELTTEIYRQIVAKDTAAASALGFDVSSNQRQSLAFLAQLEYSLREREDSSVTLNEIYSALTTEYLYFEQLRTETSTKSSSLQSVTSSVARLHGFLLSRGRQLAATRVVDRFVDYFAATEGNSLKLNTRQGRAFVETILEYFSAHTSQNFVRSVAIASYNAATQMLASEDYEQACHLSLAAFKYIWAHQGYESQATLKLVFKLGLVIAGRDIKTRPSGSTRKEMLSVSATILRDTLGYFKKQNIDLAQLDLGNLNSLIGVLDDQHDYHTLAWVLNSLWNGRDAHSTSQPQSAYTLALGRMLVITRYLIGDYTVAVRLAEDIVYNCARVHGPRHPSTVEMTVLLSQMYTSVAQGYQNQKDRRELAYRYYKKAASLHENALRVFIDPSSVSSTEMDDRTLSGASSPSSGPSEEEEGKYVRQHLHLLKLAVERLGDWPKEYAEYERLNSELFRTFGNDLKGVDGVEKWNLKRYGSGHAEASDDLISSGINQGVGFYERLAIAV
ncbi:NACHT domain protein [Aspergillus ellipticus CBS 707.79]|uniref:NACHT domain protein n=1 Tax=Aspergillus ellipticus CBS 707.79 TaxID=1448320 RepID=A0A319DMK6_9EURO|nr:NACHT domain protein [Aspergillus ellipticus CBS 707.79]